MEKWNEVTGKTMKSSMLLIGFIHFKTSRISWLFVNVEQLACFLFCEGVLVVRAVRAGAGKLRSWIPAIGGLLVCGIVIAGMFALDGKITFGGSFIPKAVTYGVMALALAGMAVAEHFGNRRIQHS